ncbi:hypothetical protein N7452_003446 [Penicillium brevicompactum]|uniref:Protein kinase domain-containing protein n=1 Tax=Penicillium brevicompactum TaxID=5074 RepID=A0A9W9UJZ8_PENBR|nr:hypothetical protein N7452_003446 [Penicillium brevicompactum]
MGSIIGDTQPQVLYFNAIPIRAESVQKLSPKRQVYRFVLDPCQELHGLPAVVIVKGMKEGWHDEFEEEKKNYERFKSLQGLVIPVFFGEGTFNDGPIIILSEVVGKTLYELSFSKATISLDGLRVRLENALESIHLLGAEYLDQQLSNFILCDTGEIMIVDFEQIDFPPDLEVFRESVNYGGVGTLLYYFSNTRERINRMPEDVYQRGPPYMFIG